MAAFYFVMALLADSASRAARDTLSTVIITVEETIGQMVRGGPRCGWNLNIADNTARPNRNAPGSDQSVTQAESAQSCRVGDVSL